MGIEEIVGMAEGSRQGFRAQAGWITSLAPQVREGLKTGFELNDREQRAARALHGLAAQQEQARLMNADENGWAGVPMPWRPAATRSMNADETDGQEKARVSPCPLVAGAG